MRCREMVMDGKGEKQSGSQTPSWSGPGVCLPSLYGTMTTAYTGRYCKYLLLDSQSVAATVGPGTSNGLSVALCLYLNFDVG